MFRFLQHIPHFLDQFVAGKRNTHDLIVSDGIHKILVADDFNQLAIIEFRYQHLIEILDNMSQIFREGAYITEMCMRNRQSSLSANQQQRFLWSQESVDPHPSTSSFPFSGPLSSF